MSGRYTASVAERITWSTGFSLPVDQLVLGKLSTFGNFMTGTGCRPSMNTLAARAGVNLRTAHRSLRRLEADGWIVATRRHWYPTIYDVCTDRLATHPTGAKVIMDLGCGKPSAVENLSDTGVSKIPDLSDTGVTEIPDLSDTGDTKIPDLSDTGVTRSQEEDLISRSTEISIPDLISSQPTAAARRPMPDGESTKGESQTEPQQRSLPPMDVTPGAASPAWPDFMRDYEAARAEAAAHKRPLKREAQ